MMRKKLFIFIVSLALISLFVLVPYFRKNAQNTFNNPVSLDSVTTSPNPYVSPISVDYLRTLAIESEGIKLEQELSNGVNHRRYIASYLSEGYKVYGLLTIPLSDPPEKGFPAIVFCHGYIPPDQYVTTEGYVSYVDNLAKNGFVVFKIDFRGNGLSEGDPSGSYFSSAYTIDAISALKSLQKYENVDSARIGIWGHSMAGNVVLRAMEVSGDFKAGVIWSGAVYSYNDFATYGISDSSYTHKPFTTKEEPTQSNREVSSEIQKIRTEPQSIDFDDPFWTSISLTKNIKYLESPLQIHHAINDSVVDVGYSRDLAKSLTDTDKDHEFYEYVGGGHNISSPYFEQAMDRTIEFFKDRL